MKIICPLHNHSGYGKAGRTLLETALAAGYRVQAIEAESDLAATLLQDGSVRRTRVPMFPTRPMPEHQRELVNQALATEVHPDAPTLLFTSPDHLGMWGEEARGCRIGFTMIESDRLHPLWATSCRNVDLLLSPSRWCQRTIQRDVPSVPVEWMPLAVDPALWSPDGPTLDFSEPVYGGREGKSGRPAFLFVAVFATSPRKHWELLMQAVMEEFIGEDVGLFVKCNKIELPSALASGCRGRGVWMHVDEEEVVETDDMGWEVRTENNREKRVKNPVRSDEWMSALYRSADCVINIGAEGFGLPVIEAALCGVPSVTLDAGGVADINDEETGYLCPSVMRPCVGHLPYVYQREQYWPAPKTIEALRATLRRAYEDSRRKEKGEAARQRALKRYTPEALAPHLRQMIECGEGLYSSWNSAPVVSVQDPPPLTVCITSHNDLARLQACVASVNAHSPRGTWIVVADDNSDDGTVEWVLEQNRAQGRILLMGGVTPGNVAANRQGAIDIVMQGLPERFLAYLDCDTEVTPGWWHQLAAIFAANPRLGILAPMKVYPDGRIQNTGRRLKFNGLSYGMYLPRGLVYPDYLESAAMVIRPEVWQQIRWDSERFPFWYEDVDYSFQVRAAGWDIAATADVVVIHDAHQASKARTAEVDARQRLFMHKWKEVM